MKIYVKANESIPATKLFYSMPYHLKSAVEEFSYWLGVENCGNASDLDSAKEYIINRTVNNPRSALHGDYNETWYLPDGQVDLRSGSYENLIDELFDYCKSNDISVSQLSKMGRLARR